MQPYHFAENLGFEKAEHHLQKCVAVSQRLAVQAIREMLDGVSARKYRVLGCPMLLVRSCIAIASENPSLTGFDSYSRRRVLPQHRQRGVRKLLHSGDGYSRA